MSGGYTELSDSAVSDDKLGEWGDSHPFMQEIKQLYEKMDDLQEIVEEIKKIQTGGVQPDSDNQLQVWGEEHNPPETISPGCPETAELLKKMSGRPTLKGLPTHEVQKIYGRGKTRALEIMREIEDGHPDIKLRENSKPMTLHWHGD